MNGATLSRWTMSYFVLALAALLVAELMMASGLGFPSAPLTAPPSLIVVHLSVIGWLSLLMLGALTQFVPVLLGKPTWTEAIPLPALTLLVGGLVCLLAGFAHLTSILAPTGGILLAAGFSLSLLNLAPALWRARPLSVPARILTAGFASLPVTFSLGLAFSFILTGRSAIAEPFDLGVLLPVHASFGLGGWLTLTAVGVSHRLFAMFMLSPERENTTAQASLIAAACAGLLLIVGASASSEPIRQSAFWLSGLCAVTSLGCYAFDALRLFRQRMRRRLELNSSMSAVALGWLVLGALGMGGAVVFDAGEGLIAAAGYVLVFGWLSGLGLAMLYKIIAFLTWLESFGPHLGKRPTPRVQDLVVEAHARPWFLLHHFGVALGGIAAAAHSSVPFRCAAAVLAVAAFGLCREMFRTRKLRAVASSFAPPQGPPALFYATIPAAASKAIS